MTHADSSELCNIIRMAVLSDNVSGSSCSSSSETNQRNAGHFLDPQRRGHIQHVVLRSENLPLTFPPSTFRLTGYYYY